MKGIIAWLDDRIGLRDIREFLSHKTVPLHRYTVFYYLGGMTLFFFLVQVCTGVLLMLYYQPSADGAFESVEFLVTSVPFGWLVRSIHAWSANLMVFFAFLHLVSVFFMKAYRPPRELTWVSGVLLLFLALAFGFSGYLLPWNQLSFFATKVGTDVAGSMPLAGEFVMRFLRGGDRVTGATLSRFYGWHTAILPAITFAVLTLHLLLVQVKGMSVPVSCEEEARRRPPMKFFPHFALRDLSGWVFALGVLAALAAFLPWELGEKADAFAPAYENIRPEWYYMFMFQTLKLVPGGEIFGVEYEAIPIMLFNIAGLLLLLVPFLDRRAARQGRSPKWSIAAIIALVFVVGMTCWGYGTLIPLYVVFAAALLLTVFAYMTRGPHTATLALLFVAIIGGANTLYASSPSCLSCHEDQAKVFPNDIHSQVGLGCTDCHGGNPNAPADDMEKAMDPQHGYRPKPKRTEVPEFCGRCHSDAAFMKKFNPGARVDQVTEYWTSGHGKRLKQGDENVATCIDCHSVHDIRRKASPDAPVYATRVAETCNRCHSDTKRMAAYKIPTDQYARWKVSVHADALLKKGDLVAPTCNDCHGNHGAAPPGVESVSFVCGNCHARETELFRASAKQDGWARHNELLATGAKCRDCHDDVRGAVTIAHFGECVTCHENHSVVRPSVAMIGNLPDTPCAFCHEGTGPLATVVNEPRKKKENYEHFRALRIAQADQLKLKGKERFDWMLDQALQNPHHRAGDKLRPEFERLFDKFRIGKTHYDFGGVKVAVRQCADCHTDNTTAAAYLSATRGLTSMIARAERILLSAHRGGVEVRQARAELDSAVDNQIELETLVHTFTLPGQAQTKYEEGLTHAKAALINAQQSLDELQYRRRGLFVALGVIGLVLVALAIKIRTL